MSAHERLPRTSQHRWQIIPEDLMLDRRQRHSPNTLQATTLYVFQSLKILNDTLNGIFNTMPDSSISASRGFRYWPCLPRHPHQSHGDSPCVAHSSLWFWLWLPPRRWLAA
ncbi:hypothetical protein XFF6990_140065 [Xanthomonas citri pv. fuscans]|uniref:Uncharacterized protein n=1 Tax=Xanthomonas campestris pv. phaseoli TaxID=317013 RepID=A0A7Z7IXV8_XANCH|nr:hypothetical protein XFF6990_140065 [Xanthomonas citri pv. fuscans]SOO23616.1 hypothetical protein XFF6991_290023 [Xanthomonas phaseoli pv. phaseoli]